jgi:tetratricopeptide (TPR) repeat protein
MAFFESLRTAARRYAAGVHEFGAPADEKQLTAAEKRLGVALPPPHREFLRSYNGAALFHESILLFPAEEIAETPALSAERRFLRIGDTPDGALWMRVSEDPAQDGRIYLVDEEAPDPILAGASIESWLDATLAREGLCVDRDGEFRDVFSDDGLLPEVRRKQAQAGLRRDPDSALYHLEQGELYSEEGDLPAAIAALQKAVACDPQAGPAWELLATLYLDTGQLEAGEDAARRAAAAALHPPLQTARQTLATRIRLSGSLRVL